MINNLGNLADQIAKSPANAVAVALSANRNKVYRQVILQSVEIVNDIRMVCLSDVKMTEKERTEVFFGVRPKLKEMNKTLQRLVRAVKYTSLTDVWNEISGNQPDKADIEDISKESFQRWRTIGKTVRP
jgi:tRNA A37 threonylcarbamoyladenosine modification protein TsaB